MKSSPVNNTLQPLEKVVLDWKSPPTQPNLGVDNIHLWSVELDVDVTSIARYRGLLSSDELTRADRFRFSLHRQHFIACRGLLRTILSKYIDVAPQAIQFRYGEFGKPEIRASDLKFNVSHSFGRALIALTRESHVGVDLEHIRIEFKTQQIVERYFGPTERHALNGMPASQKRAAFYRLWTLKEAYMKATGLGLSCAMDAIEVDLESDRFSINQINPLRNLAETSWVASALDPHEGFVGAIAYSGAPKQTSTFLVKPG